MKKITCTVALAGVALTALLGSSPALAASEPVTHSESSASPEVRTGTHIKEVVRSFDQWVSVSYIVAGGIPGTYVYGVNQSNGENTRNWKFDENGEAVVYKLPMKAGEVNTIQIRSQDSSGGWHDVISTVFDDTRNHIKPPTAEITPNGPAGKTHVDFTGLPEASIRLSEAGKREFVSSVRLDKNGRASLDLDTPDHEIQYDVYQYFEGAYSAPGQLTLGAGQGTPSPEAPKVDVTGTTTRGDAVVTVQGEAGNSTTVRNKAGKFVAIKMIGKNGKTQLTVPKDDTYMVRQAHGTESISKADSIVID